MLYKNNKISNDGIFVISGRLRKKTLFGWKEILKYFKYAQIISITLRRLTED